MNQYLPSDPEIIEEYIEILKAIEKETQIYDPIRIETLLEAVEIERKRAHQIIRNIADNTSSGIRIESKPEEDYDPMGLDAYSRGVVQKEYVGLLDKVKFKRYLDKLSSLLIKSYGTPRNSTTISAYKEQEVDWPEGFKWKDENTYNLDGKGAIPFMDKRDSKIKKYFRMMADEKNFVETKRMAEETGETDEQVKIKLNQIDDKIKNLGLGNFLAVEARGLKPSAYRLIPYPKET